LVFLESLMDQKDFIKGMFRSNNYFNHKPIEQAVKSSNTLIVKHLFAKKEVQDRYQNNDVMIHRLFIFLFAHNMDPRITDIVLPALKINKEKVLQMFNYKCPKQKGDRSWYKKNILTAIIWTGTFDHLMIFIDFIGKQVFIDNLFNIDQSNRDVMRWAICTKKVNVIEYILAIDEIKEKYMSDMDSLHYLCASMNEFNRNKECVKYVVDTLGITKEKLTELNKVRKIKIKKILPFTK